ncbi:MAG: hypothetical protein HC871_03905 [Rhizobiales bacterium]|nr:hypothetical protein [Hyphomicrobiales bacterium]
MSVADWSGTLIDWKSALVELRGRIAPSLGRSKTKLSAGAFINGLLSGTERKTGWMLAEEAGLERPYRIQSLLGRSSWSADHLRDLVRDYVVEAPGCSDGVLVIDETGFLKKGRHWSASAVSIRGQPGGSRIARSASSPAMPAVLAMLLSTGSFICPKTGLRTRHGAAKRMFQAIHLRHQASDGARYDCANAGCRPAQSLRCGRLGTGRCAVRRRFQGKTHARRPPSGLCSGRALEPHAAISGRGRPCSNRSRDLGGRDRRRGLVMLVRWRRL